MPFRKPLTSLALTLLSSALLALAFPKANLFWLAWFALVPLLFVVLRSTLRAAVGFSFLCGFIFFLATLQWIHYVTTLGLILLAAYLAVYFALFGLGVRYFCGSTFAVRLAVLPAIWCVLEFIRDRLLTGFGWGALGHSQASNILLIQIADITGVAGVSFLVAGFNVMVCEILGSLEARSWKLEEFRAFILQPLASSKFRPALIYCLLLIMALAYGSSRLYSRPEGQDLRIAIIQPNISLTDYWDPMKKADTVRLNIRLSRETLAFSPDLIVWPETAFPQFIWELPKLFEEVLSFQDASGVPLVVGAVTRKNEEYHNSALFLDRERGEIYSKMHLVLFGEYIPFRKELPFLADIVPIDDFSPGREQALFPAIKGVNTGVLICFEDTIPDLARRLTQEGAGVLVNITNDAWFRDSAQPAMHLENALFRAVENRRPLVRSTNTGVSCMIDARGAVGPCVEGPDKGRVLVQGWAVGGVKPGTATTFYTKFGDVFTFFLFIVILTLFSQKINRFGKSREG